MSPLALSLSLATAKPGERTQRVCPRFSPSRPAVKPRYTDCLDDKAVEFGEYGKATGARTSMSMRRYDHGARTPQLSTPPAGQARGLRDIRRSLLSSLGQPRVRERTSGATLLYAKALCESPLMISCQRSQQISQRLFSA